VVYLVRHIEDSVGTAIVVGIRRHIFKIIYSFCSCTITFKNIILHALHFYLASRIEADANSLFACFTMQD